MPNDLHWLRAGALDWVRRNAGRLDPPPVSAQAAMPRAKAFLQLARLSRSWAHVAADDPGLDEVTALLERVWCRTELPDAFASDPGYALQYGLMYCALAPPSAVPPRELLARLAADAYLSVPRGSPYLRLELAYYADMAGVAHRIGSYRELYAASLLAGRTAALPINDADACTIAHTIFYLTDYGARPCGLDDSGLERARRMVVELTGHYTRSGEWDHAAKFLLAQFCLGLDPVRTPSGAAGIRMLARVQDSSGAIPAAAIRLMPGPGAATPTPTQRFGRAYQTTLMTALMSLMVSAASSPVRT